jgi:hypothetical protein
MNNQTVEKISKNPHFNPPLKTYKLLSSDPLPHPEPLKPPFSS